MMWILEFFKGFFIYYFSSYRQPRIKLENPLQWFELCECFIVVFLRLFVSLSDFILIAFLFSSFKFYSLTSSLVSCVLLN